MLIATSALITVLSLPDLSHVLPITIAVELIVVGAQHYMPLH